MYGNPSGSVYNMYIIPDLLDYVIYLHAVERIHSNCREIKINQEQQVQKLEGSK